MRRGRKIGQLITQLRVDSVEETQTFKGWVNIRQQLYLPGNFDSLLPLERVRLLDRRRDVGHTLEEFLRLGSQINILRLVGSRLRCVASGLNSFASSCALPNRPFTPPRKTQFYYGVRPLPQEKPSEITLVTLGRDAT